MSQKKYWSTNSGGGCDPGRIGRCKTDLAAVDSSGIQNEIQDKTAIMISESGNFELALSLDPVTSIIRFGICSALMCVSLCFSILEKVKELRGGYYKLTNKESSFCCSFYIV